MNAIRAIVDGGVVVQDELVSTRVRKLPCDDPDAAMLLAQLTSRELEALALCPPGAPPKTSRWPSTSPGIPSERTSRAYREARRSLSPRGRGIRFEARPVRPAEGRRTHSQVRARPHPNVVATPTSVGVFCTSPRLRSRPIRDLPERRLADPSVKVLLADGHSCSARPCGSSSRRRTTSASWRRPPMGCRPWPRRE